VWTVVFPTFTETDGFPGRSKLSGLALVHISAQRHREFPAEWPPFPAAAPTTWTDGIALCGLLWATAAKIKPAPRAG
jgi:hypothetical protein